MFGWEEVSMVCQECGNTFDGDLEDACPACGSYDIEIEEEY